MEILKCDEFSIGYGQLDEEGLLGEPVSQDYLLVKTDFRETGKIINLKEHGYSFHDRVLKLEIDIPSTDEIRNSKVKGTAMVSFQERASINEEMIEMACEVYDTDRRFHLDVIFNQKTADQVIRSYIKKLADPRLLVVTAIYNGTIAGFTTLPLKEENYAENVLGVTRHGIVGKVSAFPLYCEMLNILQRKGYRKYIGRVSTTNAASLNLHFQLGARVVGIEDKYIWRKQNV
jgi:L-amino acid N-acyltransferase YncA